MHAFRNSINAAGPLADSLSASNGPRGSLKIPLNTVKFPNTPFGAQTPIAALFVETDGCYFGLPDIDPWDRTRDARLYDGPWPVIAHPPCQRWGRYWGGSPTTWPRLTLGDDAGCFAAALAAVRKWGGVLEHPEGSHAWRAFGLNIPPKDGGWINADFEGGWTCCVEQGHYGHRARKATWLFASGFAPPPLIWGKSAVTIRLDDGFHSAEERRRAIKTGVCQRLSKRQRAATPIPFRDLLLSLAAQVHHHPRGNLAYLNERLHDHHHDRETQQCPQFQSGKNLARAEGKN